MYSPWKRAYVDPQVWEIQSKMLKSFGESPKMDRVKFWNPLHSSMDDYR